MSTQLSVHRVTSVEALPVKEHDGMKPFFARDLIIKTSDGEEITIVLFGDTLESIQVAS